MKICLLGATKFKYEFKFLKDELEKLNNIVYTPIIEYFTKSNSKAINIDYYSLAKEFIMKSDYLILLVEDKTEHSFIFHFGMVFGSNKEFKIISIENIKQLIISKSVGGD